MAGTGMKSRQEVGDGYLVARARDGYLDAYEMLVQRHSATAYRVALRISGNHHDAQDIAQDAPIAAWENLARFKADSSFSTWLYQIVTGRALNKINRGRDADPADLLDPVADTAAPTFLRIPQPSPLLANWTRVPLRALPQK
jgi:DNA-directed RNA polymerase specialized sigma24 family protein